MNRWSDSLRQLGGPPNENSAKMEKVIRTTQLPETEP